MSVTTLGLWGLGQVTTWGGGGSSVSQRAVLWLFVIGAALLVLFVVGVLIVKQYRRCPSNRILVIYGRVGTDRAAKCMHGGGAFVIPLIQDYAYLSLEPMAIDVPLTGALSQNNIRVSAPSTFTVAISTDPVLMNNAAERLLPMDAGQIRELAQDIILGQLRLVIATLTIEEINRDREKFMQLINENVEKEVHKIGLELINVNIRDIHDESGYIEAIGKRAAAEAINRAKVEVAQQQREGATGEAVAVREMEVKVAAERAMAAEGQKNAEQRQRIALAALEAQAVTGEVESRRNQEIALSQRQAETVAAQKQFEQEQRVKVAEAEATANVGENQSRERVALSNAQLAEVQAETRRRSEVAQAKSQEAVLVAQREQELARLAKEQLAPQEIERKRIEIAAAAEAEKLRLEAMGQADAVLARYTAEAEGIRKVLDAKAQGYQRLIEACAGSPDVAPTLLLIEKLPELVREQVKAISNLRIDKITVWDGGQGTGPGGAGKGSTAGFLSSLIGSLPPVHELAEQAGVELPGFLGQVKRSGKSAGTKQDGG